MTSPEIDTTEGIADNVPVAEILIAQGEFIAPPPISRVPCLRHSVAGRWADGYLEIPLRLNRTPGSAYLCVVRRQRAEPKRSAGGIGLPEVARERGGHCPFHAEGRHLSVLDMYREAA